MWIYTFKRLLILIPTVFGIVTITFAVTQFVPGGPIDHAMNQLDAEAGVGPDEGGSGGGGWSYSGRRGLDEAQIKQLTELYGFDKPVGERYVHMVKNFLRFDLGYSYFRHESVWDLIIEKLPVSLSLGIWAFFLTYLISVPLGIAKAVRAGSRFDFLTSLLVLTGYAVPGFVLGVLLILVLGSGSFLDLFPLRGLTSDGWENLSTFHKVTDYLWHITLPVTATVVGTFAIKTLLTKNTFLEEINRQYVLTARAKGLSERQVLFKHVLRNALLPLITGFPYTFIAAFFSGSLLIETLFSLDGLGLLSFEAIQSRDYPVVLGTLYLFTLIGLGIKLLADLAYVIADPRINFEAKHA